MLEYIGAAKSVFDVLLTLKEKVLPAMKGPDRFEVLVRPVYDELEQPVAAYFKALRAIEAAFTSAKTQAQVDYAVILLRSLRAEDLSTRTRLRATATAFLEKSEGEQERQFFGDVFSLFDGGIAGANQSSATHFLERACENGATLEDAPILALMTNQAFEGCALVWRRLSERYQQMKVERILG